MASKPFILLFGDSSSTIRPWIDDLTTSKRRGSLTSRLLADATVVLQQEVHIAISTERRELPAFSKLEDLAQLAEANTLHPALHAALLVLVQLGAFVSAYEGHNLEAFPDAHTPCVGFCLGEISATVTAAASSLLHLLELTPVAIKVAFRIGLLAARVGNSIEMQTRPKGSWSIAVDRSCGVGAQLLDQFHSENIVSPSKRIWVGYHACRTVSVCGPPSSLRRFTSWLNEQGRLHQRDFCQQVTVYAPYHAPHQFSSAAISKILRDLALPTPTRRLRPCFSSSGESVSTDTIPVYCDAEALFHSAATNILARPMDWQATCNSVTERFRAADLIPCAIRPFGPDTMGQKLTASLRASLGIELLDDAKFGGMSSGVAQAREVPIAVVGMAMRLPGARTIDEMWSSLCAGVDFVKEVPKDRFDAATLFKRQAYGCFIDNVGHFDAKFFNMSPREASQTDPGHRLAMMTALEAMENAGLVVDRTPSTRRDRIGTFYGQTVDEYKEQNMALNVDTYYIPGSLRAFAPGRLNYFFKFGGPAYAIDTACSSGAVALNLACKSIWSGECDTALAGGINTLCGCNNYIGLSAGHFLSETGGCKTFDNTADGYCRAEAVVSLIIKRHDAAVADRDHIHGIIRATATNFAADAPSITRPHGPTQEALYRSVLQEAGLRPFDVDYVELHGTGTQAGDQIETNSVLDVFAPRSGGLPRTLFLSAIKPNVGHSEAASGPTSVVKALKVLQERRFPPHVGIKTVKSELLPGFEVRNVCLPREQTIFPESVSGSRKAVVSNFSAAGGCTAFVLEESPAAPRVVKSNLRSKHPVCISAKTKASLSLNIKHLAEWLSANPNADIEDISYSTTARRQHYAWKQTFVATSCLDLQRQLSVADTDDNSAREDKTRTVLMFTGQGS